MKRPIGVTIVGILIVLEAILLIVGGLFSLIAYAADAEGMGAALLITTVVLMVFGLIYALVAKGIFHGSPGARLVVGIITVLALIASVIDLFVGVNTIAVVVSIIIKLVILWILYGTKGKEFFSRR